MKKILSLFAALLVVFGNGNYVFNAEETATEETAVEETTVEESSVVVEENVEEEVATEETVVEETPNTLAATPAEQAYAEEIRQSLAALRDGDGYAAETSTASYGALIIKAMDGTIIDVDLKTEILDEIVAERNAFDDYKTSGKKVLAEIKAEIAAKKDADGNYIAGTNSGFFGSLMMKAATDIPAGDVQEAAFEVIHEAQQELVAQQDAEELIAEEILEDLKALKDGDDYKTTTNNMSFGKLLVKAQQNIILNTNLLLEVQEKITEEQAAFDAYITSGRTILKEIKETIEAKKDPVTGEYAEDVNSTFFAKLFIKATSIPNDDVKNEAFEYITNAQREYVAQLEARDQAIVEEINAALEGMINSSSNSVEDFLPSVKAEDFDELYAKAENIHDAVIKEEMNLAIKEFEQYFLLEQTPTFKAIVDVYASAQALLNADGTLADGVTFATIDQVYSDLMAIKEMPLGEELLEIKDIHVLEIHEWGTQARLLVIEKEHKDAVLSINQVSKTYILGYNTTMKQSEVVKIMTMEDDFERGNAWVDALRLQGGSYAFVNGLDTINFEIDATGAEKVGTHTVTVTDLGENTRGLTTGKVSIELTLTTVADKDAGKKDDKKDDKKNEATLPKTGEAVAEKLVAGSSLLGLALLALFKRK